MRKIILCFLLLVPSFGFARYEYDVKFRSLAKSYEEQKTTEKKLQITNEMFNEVQKAVLDGKIDKAVKTEMLAEAVLITYKMDSMSLPLTNELVEFYEENEKLFEQYFDTKKASLPKEKQKSYQTLIRIFKDSMSDFRVDIGK